jgi:hypothetical protein
LLLESCAKKLEIFKVILDDGTLHKKNGSISYKLEKSDSISLSIPIFRDIKNDLDRLDYTLSDKQLKQFVLNKLINHSSRNSISDISASLKNITSKKNPVASLIQEFSILNENNKVEKTVTARESLIINNEPPTPNPSYSVESTHNNDETETIGIRERLENGMITWLSKHLKSDAPNDVERLDKFVRNLQNEFDKFEESEDSSVLSEQEQHGQV